MAFVPGHKHDLFLSYAHAEAAWVEAFRKALCDEFQVRAGQGVTVWQDSRNLRVGQKWASEIEEGIRDAAAFLAIVSPCYLNSAWCRQERAIVLERKLEALKTGSFYRLLKVIKTPGPGKAHEELHGELEDIRFFNPADEYEFAAGSVEFTAMTREIVRHIRELFAFMSNESQELYLAPGAMEMHNEREELKRELKDRGFTLKPETLLDSGSGRRPVLRAMDKVSHAIFLLGSEFDPFTAEQIEAACELGKACVFWVQPGPGQKGMIDRVQSLPDLPAGSERLGGRSIRELIDQLREKLKPKSQNEDPAGTTAAGASASRVYVNYDATLPEDARIAASLADTFRKRNLEVVESGRDGDHDRLMRISNAVLLFRAARPDPDQWLKLNTMELALAGQIYEKKPDFAAKALLVADPARIQAIARGIPVYPYAEDFKPEILTPFFDTLKAARPADDAD